MTNRFFPATALSTAIVAAMAAPASVLAQTGNEQNLILPQLTVTADPLGSRSVDSLIQPVTVLSGDRLEQRRTGGSLGEVVDGTPGVANSDFGPGVGRPVIRGLQGGRVQILEDGMRTIDVSAEGADHLVAVDPLRATSVEIIRGPSTLVYGSGAAGGVVNVVTNRFDPLIPERLAGSVAASFGENGNDRQSHISLDAPVTSSFALRADFNQRRTDDFDIRGYQQSGVRDTDLKGTLVNSELENDSYSVTGMFSQNWGYVGFGYSRFESDYGIPENFDARPRDEGGQEDEFERIDAKSDRFDLRSEIYNPFAGFSSARLNMSYTEFEMEEAEFEFDRTPQGGVFDERTVEAEFAKDVFEARLELSHNPIGNLVGVIGAEVSNTDFESDDPRAADRNFYVRPYTVDTGAIFVVEELATDFGKLEFGARVGRERYNGVNVNGAREAGNVTDADGNDIPFPNQVPARNFTLSSFSVGGLIDVGTTHHLRTSLTSSERAPSAEQLYAFGRHGPAGTFEVGDPDLNKETYLNLELGLDRHAGPLRYDMTVFYNLVNDFIFLQSEDDGTGGAVLVDDLGRRDGNPDAGNLRNQFVTNEQADAEFFGLEVGAEMDLDTGALPSTLRASADYVRGRLRSGGNLPRITPPRAGVGYDIAWQNYSLSLDYQRVFKQTKTGQAEDSTSGYNLIGFDLAWKPAAVNDLRLFVQGRNLANQDGRRHQSFFKDDAPIIGRAFTAGVRYDFGG